MRTKCVSAGQFPLAIPPAMIARMPMPLAPSTRCCVITALNLKGGVGKTHTAWLLASVCQERGLKLLAADLDPQGNLTSSFLAESDGHAGAEVLFDPRGEADIKDLMRRTAFDHIDLI